MRIFSAIIIIVAIIFSMIVSFWPQERLADAVYLVYVSRFFEVMLPILAVGALIKYLCPCKSSCGCCGGCNKNKV